MQAGVQEEGHHLTSPIIPDLHAWVEVDGKALQVYGATVSGNKAIGYIEVREGQRFSLHWVDQRRVRPEYDYSMQAFIDGSKVGGKVTRASSEIFDSSLGATLRRRSRTGKSISPFLKKPFLFGKLATTDSDEAACQDEHIIKNLGTLQLRYLRVIENGRWSSKHKFEVPQAPVIHEKAKKAQLSHQAAFGEAFATSRRVSVYTHRIDPSSSPFSQFEFRYRSRDLLQLEGLIPRSPSPSPVASPSLSRSSNSPAVASSTRNDLSNSAAPQNDDTASADQIARLRARYESLKRQEEMARLQREIDALEGGNGAGGSGASLSRDRKIKLEAIDNEQRDAKRVKKEAGEASLSQSSSSAKGKAKQQPEVLVLSDSD